MSMRKNKIFRVSRVPKMLYITHKGAHPMKCSAVSPIVDKAVESGPFFKGLVFGHILY